MNDQDRITVNGVELVRKDRTDSLLCFHCAGYDDAMLCARIPCNGDSYFVMVEE